MTQATPAVTPLRQRMIEDMRMRKFSPKTQASYIRAVRQFTGYLGRAPDKANVSVRHPGIDLRHEHTHLSMSEPHVDAVCDRAYRGRICIALREPRFPHEATPKTPSHQRLPHASK